MQNFYVISLELIDAHGYMESIYECTGRAMLIKYLDRFADRLDDFYICEGIIENGKATRLNGLWPAKEWLEWSLF